MFRRERKEALKVVERGREAFQPLVDLAAFRQLFDRARLEQQDTIQRPQRARPVGCFRIDAFEIVQYLREDLPMACALQHRGMQLDRLVINLRKAGLDLIETQDDAAGKGIDQKLAALVDRLHQKMTRKCHTVKIESEAAADFEVDDRKRYWDAEPALQHFVQERIARVAVAFFVALEAFLLEQEMRQKLHALDGIVPGADDWLGFPCQLRELVDARFDIEVRILLLGDKEGATSQRNRLAGGK